MTPQSRRWNLTSSHSTRVAAAATTTTTTTARPAAWSFRRSSKTHQTPPASEEKRVDSPSTLMPSMMETTTGGKEGRDMTEHTGGHNSWAVHFTGFAVGKKMCCSATRQHALANMPYSEPHVHAQLTLHCRLAVSCRCEGGANEMSCTGRCLLVDSTGKRQTVSRLQQTARCSHYANHSLTPKNP